jgi:hypothetical protein
MTDLTKKCLIDKAYLENVKYVYELEKDIITEKTRLKVNDE